MKGSLIVYGQLAIRDSSIEIENSGARGYHVDTVGKNKKRIAGYIKHQLDGDKLGEQMAMLGKQDDPLGAASNKHTMIWPVYGQ